MTETENEQDDIEYVERLNEIFNNLKEELVQVDSAHGRSGDEWSELVSQLRNVVKEDMQLLTASQASDQSNIPKKTILKAIANKDLQAKLLGNQYVFTRQAFDNWLANRRPMGRPKKAPENEGG